MKYMYVTLECDGIPMNFGINYEGTPKELAEEIRKTLYIEIEDDEIIHTFPGEKWK